MFKLTANFAVGHYRRHWLIEHPPCQGILCGYPVYAITSTILLLNGRDCAVRLYAINQFYAII